MSTGGSNAGANVLVPVADPEQALQLMPTAIDVAHERGGQVIVVKVILESPRNPFWVYSREVRREEFAGRHRDLIESAQEVALGTDVTIDGELVFAATVAAGVVEVATERDVGAILMGWHGRRRRDILMGHIVDDVVAAAPCDVLVEKIGPRANGVETVLLPAGRDAHTTLAARTSRAIARANDATVDIVRIVPTEADEDVRKGARELVESVAETVAPVDTRTAVLTGDDVAGKLVGEANERDLTVIGGGARGWLRRLVVGSTAQSVGRRAETTVVIATRPSATRSVFATALGRLRAGRFP